MFKQALRLETILSLELLTNMKIANLVRRQLKGKKRLPKMNRFVAPKSLERDYFRAISPLLRKFESLIKAKIIARLPRWTEEFNHVLPEDVRIDGIPEDILKAMSDVKIELYREYTPLEIERLANKAGMAVSDYNEFLMKNEYKRVLGFDIFMSQPYLKQELNLFSIANSQLIQNVTDTALNKVQNDVMRGFSNGTRWEEIAKDLEKYIDPLEGGPANRAQLIARDQVNKLNGQLTELRQSELGVKRYIWRTSLDERVRPEHLEKEGKIYSWDDPPEDTGNPGEDINCRCYAEPVLSDLIDGYQEQDVNLEDN